MKAIDRFLKYVAIHTTSDSSSDTQPSTARQLVLAELLVKEMQEMGISDARLSKEGYVYGSIPATEGYENAPALGLIAHMDTAPDASGENVKPILHKDYDGKDVHLPSGRVLKVDMLPEIANAKGKTLVTASGDTLLGADDKAGIAEIMVACEEILKGDIPHGKICIGFTPDEEVGRGADHFDVKGFGADYAYTMDGGPVGEIAYETFNAAEAKLSITGVGVHPGTAKDIMVNALRLICIYDEMLPKNDRPEHTDDREGFYHLMDISGNTSDATSKYIIRDHDREKFEARKMKMREAAETLQKEWPRGKVELSLTDNYANMGEVIEKHFHLVENAKKAAEYIGVKADIIPVRGGTDGSRLSFMGLPCPNLGTGGMYFHGGNECIAAEDMDLAVKGILHIIKLYAESE